MIKAPIELYPGNDDSETYLLSLPPPPTSFLAQFEQLSTCVNYFQNQVHDQENELVHNLKPILDVICQCELLAFDLAVFLNGTHRDDIHEFFEKCFSMTNGNYSFNFNSTKSILSYLKYLLTLISKLNTHFQKLPYMNNSFCIGDSANQNFEQQLCEYILNSLQHFDRSSPPNSDNKFLSINVNFKTKIETDSQEFANWLLNRYKITPSVKIRELANRLAFRLTTIFDLQETVTKMRELCSTADTARENELYTVSSIKESEKYKQLSYQCQFFSAILKYINLDRISDLANKLTTELKNQGPDFANDMSTQYEAYLSEIQTYDNWVKENERDFQILKQSLTPLAKQQMQVFSDYFPSLDASYNSFAIPKAISIFRSKYTDPVIIRKVEAIHTIYKEICRIYDEGLKTAYKIRDLELEIIDINSKIISLDDSTQLRNLEKQADSLIDRLNKFLKEVRPSNIDFQRLSEKLKGIGKKIDIIETNLFKSIDDFNISLKNEFVPLPLPTDLAKQRDELLQKIKEADKQLIQSHKLVYDIREKKASLGKWSEISSELIGANVNSIYQSNYAQMEKMVICPVCNSNYRNVLIDECGHIICSFCFEECRNKKVCTCPVCQEPFKPFEFEILENPKFFNNLQMPKT